MIFGQQFEFVRKHTNRLAFDFQKFAFTEKISVICQSKVFNFVKLQNQNV